MNKFGIKHPLRRSEFVNELCAIWDTGMKKENSISSFENTGMSYSLTKNARLKS